MNSAFSGVGPTTDAPFGLTARTPSFFEQKSEPVNASAESEAIDKIFLSADRILTLVSKDHLDSEGRSRDVASVHDAETGILCALEAVTRVRGEHGL